MYNNLTIESLGNNKNEIIVPKGIRFISNWTDYNLNDFQFPHILDKKIPGCGYTEYAIRNTMNIILCSPRKILLKNKEKQHLDEVFYFQNELDEEIGCDKDLTKTKAQIKEERVGASDEKRSLILENLRNQLKNYVSSCIYNSRPAKILVTYDSFRLVKEFLMEGGRFDDFYIVVDEFQSVLVDARFKSSTEMDFLNQLQGIKKVCYVSATPMIDEYLSKISEFAHLPYFELNWTKTEPTRAIQPQLKVRVTQSITGTAKEIIDSYKDGEFKIVTQKREDGGVDIIKSTEAVFYVNSVNNIISIIKKTDLAPDQVNILCANTPENKKRIKTKLSADFKIGDVPLKGEKNKMFTFCTRTVYLGADFYSDNARTFILSDANIDSLSVDISLDLPQILGRQRLPENPWKNHAEFYYKTLNTKNEVTKEVFDAEIDRKLQHTQSLLRSWGNANDGEDKFILAKSFQYIAENRNYKEDYVAVNRHSGKTLVPCVNHLVMIAEQRAFDIQQVSYKDRFTVFNTLQEYGMIESELGKGIEEFKFKFESFTNFPDKMKFLCESKLPESTLSIILDQIPLTYKNYYLTLGPDRCRANGYKVDRIRKEFDNLCMDKTNLVGRIMSEFLVGNRYLITDIKEKLREIYNQVGLNKTPKATDLESYFEIKKCEISVDGKRLHGYSILSKK